MGKTYTDGRCVIVGVRENFDGSDGNSSIEFDRLFSRSFCGAIQASTCCCSFIPFSVLFDDIEGVGEK